jgi:hypothetical protein
LTRDGASANEKLAIIIPKISLPLGFALGYANKNGFTEKQSQGQGNQHQQET